MENNLELGVTTMFRDATMQSVVLELRTPADWDSFMEIKDTALASEKKEIEDFANNKPQLLAEARKVLMDKAGAHTLEHPTPFGADRLDKAAIDRQVKIKVETDHQARLLEIKTVESKGFDELKQDIHARESVSHLARDAFGRSTNRRDGEDHRMPSRDR